MMSLQFMQEPHSCRKSSISRKPKDGWGYGWAWCQQISDYFGVFTVKRPSLDRIGNKIQTLARQTSSPHVCIWRIRYSLASVFAALRLIYKFKTSIVYLFLRSILAVGAVVRPVRVVEREVFVFLPATVILLFAVLQKKTINKHSNSHTSLVPTLNFVI